MGKSSARSTALSSVSKFGAVRAWDYSRELRCSFCRFAAAASGRRPYRIQFGFRNTPPRVTEHTRSIPACARFLIPAPAHALTESFAPLARFHQQLLCGSPRIPACIATPAPLFAHGGPAPAQTELSSFAHHNGYFVMLSSGYCEVPFTVTSLFHDSFHRGTVHDQSNTIHWRDSFLSAVGFSFVQRPFKEAGKNGICLRLFADQIMLVHDRSQNGRPLCLWHARWPPHATGAARQRLGEGKSRRSRALKTFRFPERIKGHDLPDSAFSILRTLSHSLPYWP